MRTNITKELQMVTIEYLESERQKIWSRIIELQESIDKKTTEYESEARQASKKCSEYRNKCESAKNDSISVFSEIKSTSENIINSGVITQIAEIQSFHSEVTPKKEAIEAQITELETLFAEYDSYAEQLEKLDALCTSADDSSVKIDAIFSQLTARKKEVDQLYFDIFGFTKTDETSGKEIKVAGRKAELDNAYTSLKNDFDQFTKDKKGEFNGTLTEWEQSYSKALSKIESLLPNALTAGLSHAYLDKKDKEILERDKLSASFNHWIVGLIVISIIPFAISIYLLTHGATLEQTILKLPNLAFSILPLYIPPLWVAISLNRRMNLSKRLIEEYTHKEVLSKTYEGLSKQIESIKDSKNSTISSDLKAKLLQNILEVSSENPGKLVSDYNKSDHPLLDKLFRPAKDSNPKNEQES